MAKSGRGTYEHYAGFMYADGEALPAEYHRATFWLQFRYNHVSVDEQSATKWMQGAAKRGHRLDQHNLGLAYYLGLGIERDLHQAERWFLKAAEQRLAQAQHNLGVLYRLVDGFIHHRLAVKWFRQAAEQELPEAQHRLGVCYYEGEGIGKDLSQSLAWLSVAAAAGVESASELKTSLAANMSAAQRSKADQLIAARQPVVDRQLAPSVTPVKVSPHRSLL